MINTIEEMVSQGTHPYITIITQNNESDAS